ncbi:MAG: protein phosphatase 2C domain-containing protein [Lachnospiraceae bacterium]|nr:protein phosphatase 2C domain-containing protein [Lachnospiraceae bacterium]
MGYEWKENTLVAAVCDGMGGMAGGEQASHVAIQTIFGKLRGESLYEEGRYPRWIQEVFVSADRNVYELTDGNGNFLQAGSTGVLLMIKGSHLFWGSVGDSGIYLLPNDGVLRRVNRMHNYSLRLEEMYQKGEISAVEKAAEEVHGEALISYLGIGGLPLMDFSRQFYAMEDGDVLILCSDGLYKSLDEQQIQVIIEESGGNMTLAAQRLCEEAWRLATGKQDNTTVIAVRYFRR